MKNINKLFATLIMVITLSYSSAFSQTESITIKSTGQLRVFSGGKLKLNADNGKLRTTGTGSVVSNQGEIQFNGTNNTFTYNAAEVCEEDQTNQDTPDNVLALGQSPTTRITGLVSYASITAEAQSVQARYYTDLTMASVSDKSIPDEVYVSGSYLAPGTGDRNYVGEFTYDGATAQTILGETGGGQGGGSYDNVVFKNAGVKTLVTGTTADIQNLTIQTSTGNVVISGTMNVNVAMTQPTAQNVLVTDGTINLGTGASVLAGTVTISGTSSTVKGTLNQDGTGGSLAINGTVNVNNFGNFNLTEGSATIGAGGTLALGDFVDAKIKVENDQTLTVTGTMTNALVIGTNTDFGDASTVVYDGGEGQIVMATTEANDYGNLTISGIGEKTATGTVAVGGNFNLKDENFDLGNCDPTNLAFLWLTDQTATATYGAGGSVLSPFEVVGRVRRTIGGVTSDLTFNNYATKVAIEQNAANVNWVELCVNPGATNYAPGYDETRNVKRTIKFGYEVNTSSIDWAAAVSYGYKPLTESVSAMQTDAFQKSYRFRETNSDQSLDEKVSTTEKITRDISSGNLNPFNSARLAKIRPTGGKVAPQTVLAEVADDNLLYLRGGPAEFISVANGRWSNPATWDEGEQPGPLDIARVRTNVHIGFERAGIDGGQAAGKIEEEVALVEKNVGTYLTRSNLIAKIIIEEIDTESPNLLPTLIVGSDNETDPKVGITEDLNSLITDSGTILITNVPGATLYDDLTAFNATGTGVGDILTNTTNYNRGLLVLSQGNLLARNNICVEGAFNNGGEVNVAEED